jgi:uncharacterized metal-binding protein
VPGGLPTNVKPVLGNTRAAKKIITVDGCPYECSRTIVEQAGFKPIGIVLTRDIGMKKKGLSEDIGKETKGVMEYISSDYIQKTKDLTVKKLTEA